MRLRRTPAPGSGTPGLPAPARSAGLARSAGGGRSAVPAVDWPEANALVTIAGAGWPERASRVEDHGAGLLAVAAPRAGAGELEPPLEGAAFEVCWPGARGVVQVPVVLRERQPGAVPLWWLEPTGPAAVRQRREHVRASVAGWPVRVALTTVLPAEHTVEGDVLDLSEGGLRARMSGWEAEDGTPVAVRLTLAQPSEPGPGAGVDVVEHELAGTALRAHHEDGGRAVVVVQLHEAGRRGDELRAVVFAWQRAARRT